MAKPFVFILMGVDEFAGAHGALSVLARYRGATYIVTLEDHGEKADLRQMC